MDNLTHGLLGYALYAATDTKDLSRKERAGYAAAAVIGAEIPDIESFTTFFGDEAYLTWHRGFTHSFLFSPAMALLALGIVALFNRFRPLEKGIPAGAGRSDRPYIVQIFPTVGERASGSPSTTEDIRSASCRSSTP